MANEVNDSDCAEHSLFLRMPLDNFDTILIYTNIRVDTNIINTNISWSIRSTSIYNRFREIEKGRDMTQSYDKHPLTTDSASLSYIKDTTKHSMTQRLRTNSGQSVTATTVTRALWIT